ncbi:MAG: disulfide bond formation protein B [Rubrivivax sp.]
MSLVQQLRRLGPRTWLVLIALACLASVGAALVSQHVYNMQPCPWCVLQRLVYVLIAVFALAGAAWPTPAAHRAGAAFVALLAAAGAAAALWQHFVAASSASCNLTLADKLMTTLGLDEALPEVFAAFASCADAKVNLLGVPYEYWSLALFAAVAAAAWLFVWRRRL